MATTQQYHNQEKDLLVQFIKQQNPQIKRQKNKKQYRVNLMKMMNLLGKQHNILLQKQYIYSLNPLFQQTINTLKPMLHLEYQILKSLYQSKYGNQAIRTGENSFLFDIPNVFQYQEQDYFCFMVMQLLDITLEVIILKYFIKDFANKQKKNLFEKDILVRIFYAVLKILQSIHKLGYIHRDLKPANFMLKKINVLNQQGNKKSSDQYSTKIYPIDLGLCKRYVNSLTNKHIPCKQNKKMVGTAIFCSLNTHKGIQQSRRDDIESLVYMIAYLVKKLPWQQAATMKPEQKFQKLSPTRQKYIQPLSPVKRKQITIKKLDTYEEIYQMKLQTNFQQFFNDPDILPKCFATIYKYSRNMEFEEEPNYQYLYGLLQRQYTLITGKKLYQVKQKLTWESFCLKKDIKEQILQSKAKKIKINFKIPPSKLKKSQPSSLSSEKQSNQAQKSQILPSEQLSKISQQLN